VKEARGEIIVLYQYLTLCFNFSFPALSLSTQTRWYSWKMMMLPRLPREAWRSTESREVWMSQVWERWSHWRCSCRKSWKVCWLLQEEQAQLNEFICVS